MSVNYVTPTRRWLLLEQWEERSRWGIKSESEIERKANFIVISKSGECQLIISAPKLEDNQVVVWFRHPPPSGTESEAKPEDRLVVEWFLQGYNQEASQGERQFLGRLWCHYGGDLRLDELGSRWSSWPRLAKDLKQQLYGAGGHAPFPYSGRGRFRWSDEFSFLRKTISDKLNTPAVQSETLWSAINNSLERAGEGARPQIDWETRIAAMNKSLSGILLVRNLRAICPENPRDPKNALDIYYQLCDLCKLTDMQSILFASPALNYLEPIATLKMGVALRISLKDIKDTEATDALDLWRREMDAALVAYAAESKAITKWMTRNPHVIESV